jgi:hypothetical protein
MWTSSAMQQLQSMWVSKKKTTMSEAEPIQPATKKRAPRP